MFFCIWRIHCVWMIFGEDSFLSLLCIPQPLLSPCRQGSRLCTGPTCPSKWISFSGLHSYRGITSLLHKDGHSQGLCFSGCQQVSCHILPLSWYNILLALRLFVHLFVSSLLVHYVVFWGQAEQTQLLQGWLEKYCYFKLCNILQLVPT